MCNAIGDRCSWFPSFLVLACFFVLSSGFSYVIVERNHSDRLWTLAVYAVLAGLFMHSLLSVMLKDAGSVTREVLARMDPASGGPTLIRIETKRDGSPRFCRACKIPKPDRTHHCHACRRCHMRMDHHCAFVNNCVGYRNHKFFFLFLWWGAWTSSYVAYSCFHGFIFYRPIRNQFLHTVSLSCFLFGSIFSLVFIIFFGFQMFLVCRGYTVLEFVEKRRRPQASGKPFVNPFHVGIWRNLCQVLGDSPLLWFVPVSAPPIPVDFPTNNRHNAIPVQSPSPLSRLSISDSFSPTDLQSPSEARRRANAP